MIELKEFTKKFDGFTALEAVTFQVEEGSIFGLVGSNGAGKSTLLRGISGVYAPDGGQVLIDGQEPYENTELKSRVFFVSDYPYFMAQFTLRDMADFFRRLYPNWSQEEYQRLCKIFPLDQKMKIHNMSKGMQRQAALICALSTMPDYLLMDEVFDGLDPVMRQAVKSLFAADMADRNLTPIIASHNLRELEDICDHVGLLHKGGILLSRDLDDMKLNIHKVQCVLKEGMEPEQIVQLETLKVEKRGRLSTITARGKREEIETVMASVHPVFYEIIPLSLEEIFISETEVVGYDIKKLVL